MASTANKEMTDVRQYCDTIYRELSDMKKKAFGIVCNVETSSVAEEKRRAEYFELFELVDYIEEKLESLTKACPPDWGSTKEEIEGVKNRISDAIDWWYG